MKTMKKEELQKELDQLRMALDQNIRVFFRPLARAFDLINRVDYLENELYKVTPKYQGPKIAEEQPVTEGVEDVVAEEQKENP